MQSNALNDISEIADSFAGSVEVSPQNVYNSHEYHATLYKNRNKAFENQELRRKELLEIRKNKRCDLQMKLRQIVDESSSDEECPMEAESAFSRSKKPRKYKNTLMLSEWMVEVPSDFIDNWILVICPVGKRCLVVSSKGGTKAFARNGYLIKCFASELPAGNKYSERKYKQRSVLDCIFCENEKTFYVLDILFWNDISFFESEAEFRFYWLSSKLTEECPKLTNFNETNEYKFLSLKRYHCGSVNFAEVVRGSQLFKSQIDGLLFFHKQSEYTVGVSPLVCWLKPDMLQGVLHATLSDANRSEEKCDQR